MEGTTVKRKLKSGKNTWGYVFDGGKHADGKRRQIVRRGFKTEREAADAMRAAIAAYQNGNRIERDTRLFGEFFTDWLKAHGAAHWGRMTAEQNQKRAAYAIRMFGDVLIQNLGPQRIEQDLQTLLRQGGQNGRRLSPKTVRDVAALVSQCLDKAVRWKIIDRNPMQDVDRPAAHKKEVQIPQLEDYEKLLHRVTGTRYFPFVVFSAASGCRRGEQLALTWSDIDLNTGVVTVSKSLSQTREGLEIKTPKSRKSRSFRISQQTIDVLLEHRAQLERERELYEKDYKGFDLVFCTPDGDYYQPDQISNRIAEFMREAGIDASLHSLRHFSASMMLSEKVPLPVVSKRLGHANSQITLNVYSHE